MRALVTGLLVFAFLPSSAAAPGLSGKLEVRQLNHRKPRILILQIDQGKCRLGSALPKAVCSELSNYLGQALARKGPPPSRPHGVAPDREFAMTWTPGGGQAVHWKVLYRPIATCGVDANSCAPSPLKGFAQALEHLLARVVAEGRSATTR